MNRTKLLLLALSLVILTAFSFQGIQRIATLYVQTLRVTNSSEFQGTNTFSGASTFTGAVVANGVTFVGRSTFIRIQDADAAPSVRAAATVIATVSAVSSGILGIEYPRNLVVTYLTATTATVGNITVAGINARGLAATELIAVAAISGSQTLVGVVPWQSVTSLTLPTRAEDVTLTVAGGQLFGLPYVPAAAGDVYHVTVNKTPAVPTVDTTNGTFNPVSTPAANVDYNIWMKQ